MALKSYLSSKHPLTETLDTAGYIHSSRQEGYPLNIFLISPGKNVVGTHKKHFGKALLGEIRKDMSTF